MNIAICDENNNFGEFFKNTISRYMLDNNVMANCFVFQSALDLMSSNEIFDVVFFETGFSMANIIQISNFLKRQNEAVALIFISDDYTFLNTAFDLGARRYLVKPINKGMLLDALDTAINYLDKETVECYIDNKGTISKILKSSIIYLEISGRNTNVVTKSDVYTSKTKLQQWQEYLSPAQFAAPHKSYIVNMQQISECRRFSGQYYLCMSDKNYIPITRTRKAEFEKAYFQFLKNKKLM